MPRRTSAFSCLAIVAAAVTLQASQTTMIGRPPSPDASSADVLVVQQVNLTTGQSFGTMPAQYAVELQRRLTGTAEIAFVGWAGGGISLSRDKIRGADLASAEATFNTLSVLGIQPALGRNFTEADVVEGRRLAILTAGSWERLFGRRADVIGTPMWWTRPQRPPEPVEIIGVLPPGVLTATPELDPRTEALVLIDHRFPNARSRDRSTAGVLRLRPGVSLGNAQHVIDEAVATARTRLPEREAGFGVRLSTLRPK